MPRTACTPSMKGDKIYICDHLCVWGMLFPFPKRHPGLHKTPKISWFHLRTQHAEIAALNRSVCPSCGCCNEGLNTNEIREDVIGIYTEAILSHEFGLKDGAPWCQEVGFRRPGKGPRYLRRSFWCRHFFDFRRFLSVWIQMDEAFIGWVLGLFGWLPFHWGQVTF